MMSLKVLIPILWLANIVAASTPILDLPTVASLDKKAKSNKTPKSVKAEEPIVKGGKQAKKSKSPKNGKGSAPKKTKEPKATEEPTTKATKKPKKPKKSKKGKTKAPKAPKGSETPKSKIEVFAQITGKIAPCPPAPGLNDELVAAAKEETGAANVTVESFVFTCNSRRERRLQVGVPTFGEGTFILKFVFPGPAIVTGVFREELETGVITKLSSSAALIESSVAGLSGIVTTSMKPSPSPTSSPTSTPTASPSSSPTSQPTSSPTHAPTISARPTSSPTAKPSVRPSGTPSASPVTNTVCGCKACTAKVLDSKAGAYTCRARIDWLQTSVGGSKTETQACKTVASEFPNICGPSCDPDKCPENNAPSSQPTKKATCGCKDCTPKVLSTDAKGYTCGDRIDWLQTSAGGNKTEKDACKLVANDEFPTECGLCNPDNCEGPSAQPSSQPSVASPCGCSTCTSAVLSTDAKGYTCGARIDWLQSSAGGNKNEKDACKMVANDEFPTECGLCDPDNCVAPSAQPSSKPSGVSPCGCSTCTAKVLDSKAKDSTGDYTCGARIDWLQSSEGGNKNEKDACKQVANDEFPTECGLCDPDNCVSGAPSSKPSSSAQPSSKPSSSAQPSSKPSSSAQPSSKPSSSAQPSSSTQPSLKPTVESP